MYAQGEEKCVYQFCLLLPSVWNFEYLIGFKISSSFSYVPGDTLFQTWKVKIVIVLQARKTSGGLGQGGRREGLRNE